MSDLLYFLTLLSFALCVFVLGGASYGWLCGWLAGVIKPHLQEMEKRLMATMEELLQKLNAASEKVATIEAGVAKIGAETDGLNASVQQLRDALANAGNTTPEVNAALEVLDAQLGNLKASVDAVDAKVPDAPVPVPEPTPEPTPTEPAP